MARAGSGNGAIPVQFAVMAMVAAVANPLVCPPAPTPQQARLGPPPVAACTAAAPAQGEAFTGTVLQVIDGQTICVAFGPTPDSWVRVRLADAGAGRPRGALMASAFAKEVTCVASAADGDGVTAVCTVEGRSVGKAASDADATVEAADWR